MTNSTSVMETNRFHPTPALIAFTIVATFLLAACGGGGGSNDSTTPPGSSGSSSSGSSSSGSSSSGSSSSSSGAGTQHTIRLAWGASTDPALSGYVVYHRVGSGSYTDVVWVGPSTTYDYDSYSSGAHTFAVTAVADSGQESIASNEVSITIP